MFKKLIFVFALLFSLNFYAQSNFKKGYYIDNNDVKTDCFILCEHWQNEPVRFIYKNLESDTSKLEMPVGNVKEFGVEGIFKFKKFDLLVDSSRNQIGRLTYNSEPEWVKKTGFLRVIVEGNASLYEYRIQNTYKYFYSFNNSPVEQLIYKRYLENNVQINTNMGFQRQLWAKVKCSSTTLERIRKLEYREKKLTDYFLEVNNCNLDQKDLDNNEIKKKSIVDKTVRKEGNFLIKAKAGVSFNSLQVDFSNYDLLGRPNRYSDFKFDGGMAYNVGFDLEYIFPTKKKNWSIFSEFAYHSKYESNKKIPVVGLYYASDADWNISYSYLDLGLGLSYYMLLNNNSKLFLNVSGNHSLALKSKLENQIGYGLLITDDNPPYLRFGLGYCYKKYSIEFKFSNRNILYAYNGEDSKYKELSFVLGYTLFESNK